MSWCVNRGTERERASMCVRLSVLQFSLKPTFALPWNQGRRTKGIPSKKRNHKIKVNEHICPGNCSSYNPELHQQLTLYKQHSVSSKDRCPYKGLTWALLNATFILCTLHIPGPSMHTEQLWMQPMMEQWNLMYVEWRYDCSLHFLSSVFFVSLITRHWRIVSKSGFLVIHREK